MLAALERPHARFGLFVALAVAVNVIDSFVARSLDADSARRVFALAITVDIVGVVGLLYYVLLVKPGLRAPSSLGLVLLASAMRATAFHPNGTLARAALIGTCEVGVLAFAVHAVRRWRGESSATTALCDPLDVIHEATLGLLPQPGLARLLAAELGAVYYALRPWRAQPHTPPGARAFAMDARSGLAGVWGILAGLAGLEVVALHLLLAQSRPGVAWVATAFGAYGLLWFVGFARAIRLRPVLVSATHLDVRYGLAFRLRLERQRVASIRPATPADRREATVVPSRRTPAWCLALTEPVVAEGLFGRRIVVRRLALTVDDDRALGQALAGWVE